MALVRSQEQRQLELLRHMRCKQERRSWCSRFRKEQHKQEQRRSRCRKELHM